MSDELSLCAAAYRRSMTRLDARQEAVIRALAYLGIGEGEVSLGVEDADEVGATLDEGAIPRLGQGQFLHGTVVALLTVFWRVVRVLVAHDGARKTRWESCSNVALDRYVQNRQQSRGIANSAGIYPYQRLIRPRVIGLQLNDGPPRGPSRRRVSVPF